MPLANKPLVEYQVELMARHGARDVVFCAGVGAEAVEDYFKEYSTSELLVKFSIETTPLGTAGAVRFAEPHMNEDTVVVTNGDNLVDYDLSALVEFHKKNRADATIGLMTVPSPTPCGIVRTDDAGRVTAFEEPSEAIKKALASGQIKPDGVVTVNSGIYVLEREALLRIAYGANCSIEREFFPSLVRDGLRVFGYPLAGYFLDIGTPAAYLRAHRDVLSGAVEVDIIGNREPAGFWSMGEVQIDPSAKVSSRCHLGLGCRIGAGAVIDDFSSIGAGCVIGDGAKIEGSVLLENVVVGAGAMLVGAILDKDSRLGDGAVLGAGSIVASGSILLGS